MRRDYFSGEGEFVDREIVVRGSTSVGPNATVLVNGVQATFNGVDFSAPLSFASDGPATITVRVETPYGWYVSHS